MRPSQEPPLPRWSNDLHVDVVTERLSDRLRPADCQPTDSATRSDSLRFGPDFLGSPDEVVQGLLRLVRPCRHTRSWPKVNGLIRTVGNINAQECEVAAGVPLAHVPDSGAADAHVDGSPREPRNPIELAGLSRTRGPAVLEDRVDPNVASAHFGHLSSGLSWPEDRHGPRRR